MAREELRELLKCSICLETYTNPRMLSCSHICCQGCLHDLRSQGQPGNRAYSCPLCRQDTPEPPGGAAGLQSVQTLTNNLKDILGKIPPVKAASYCSQHGDKELELYCGSCDEFMCYKCAHKGSNHFNHHYVDVRSSLEITGIKLSQLVFELLMYKERRQFPEGASQSTKRCYDIFHDFATALNNVQDEIDSALKLEGDDRVVKMWTVVKEIDGKIKAIAQRAMEQIRRPDPLLSMAVGTGLKEATLREKSMVGLRLVSYDGKACKRADVECWLASGSGRLKTTCREETTEGPIWYRYFSYYPTSIGMHKLHIKVNGSHIKDSPFTVMVKPRDITDIKLKEGGGIAIAIDGGVVVCEETGHCVSFLQGGRLFGSFGSKKGQFKSPRGLAVDRIGNILVADSGNHRIQKFTAEGKCLKLVGTRGSGRLQFNCPLDIAIHPCNCKVYIVDKNRRVQILNPDLTYAGSFENHGFAAPSSIACDSTGNVYVADIGATKCNCRVKVFTAEGNIIRRFGIDTDSEPKFEAFVAIGARDVVYLGIDSGIFTFTGDGKLIGCFPILNSRGLAASGEVIYVRHVDHVRPYHLKHPNANISSNVTSTASPSSQICLLAFVTITVVIFSIIIGAIISQ